MESITKSVPIEIPQIPNFIKVGNSSYPIGSFTRKELEEIGRAWTDKLIEKAKPIN